MIKVPVLIGFDNTNPIGLLEIDETKLPYTHDFSFTIGCKITSANSYELISISIVNNSEHLSYLNSDLRKNLEIYE